ncbi:ABC transporter substrate-binding protein [Aminobacter sp. NyZ550]|uniref:Branched-chain amino acid transport system substrate-binding protein n=1 Tax=Aminobacter ciceronei TaxID=150723 RepID=A0ABR6C3S1_9HYPH|nr:MULTISPECIES: ABC transporter substrate-binding protein [Aminobacter]MBA8905863.1 branched-chain amino acid transport system substrate-binding protein [Aminobacter ciceronei]MBA9019642.1 branched-chain amino acid transport system substrate-binding protein [Aminobacter ciceronei]MRX34210.1 ABC transporter substrate-binding protein [Aminobacter sp. MDW-2]QNH32935.1 ABC transporter substrate-binding protein [Aminobacter sp. MDW-2]WAX93874.1 ABC transporter substrate-binding protein [Aminobacte
MNVRTTLLAASIAAFATFPAMAADPVKIGMITTLSGPAGYLGQDIRDGFMLALEEGKLGGVPVELVVEDDGLKPGQGKQIAERFMGEQGIKLFTGIVFSNVAGATVPDIVDNDAFYVSPNAAPSNMAGKECNPNYFVVSWQNDSLHESAGQNATNLGYKKAFVLAPNYQAGKDAIAGFKRYFKGEIAGEIYTRLDQTDFAAELAQVRAAKPDVVFQFHPGGLGITFLRQYEQSGLMKEIPMVVAEPSMDGVTLAAVGDAAIGLNVTSHWNADFDNAANKKFMDAWNKAYDRPVTYYASQGYDAALAYASALKATGGSLDDADAFRDALRKADFESVRGKFAFGPNQHPVQNWYALKVEKGDDGKPMLKTVGEVLKDHGDAYAAECKL